MLTRLKNAVTDLEERASRLAEGGEVMADGGDGESLSVLEVCFGLEVDQNVLLHPVALSSSASLPCALPNRPQPSQVSWPTGVRSSESYTTQVSSASRREAACELRWLTGLPSVRPTAPKEPSLSSSAPLRDPTAPDDSLLQPNARDASDEPEPVPTLVRLEVAAVSGSS